MHSREDICSALNRIEEARASLSTEAAPKSSAEPILGRAETYGGSIIDLDQGRVIDPATFRRGWHSLSRQMVQAGLEPGDRVVMAVGNSPLFLAALAAVLRARARRFWSMPRPRRPN